MRRVCIHPLGTQFPGSDNSHFNKPTRVVVDNSGHVYVVDSVNERIQKFSLIVTLPVVTTTAVGSISTTATTGGDNVTSDGGATVTERGVCYSLNANPALNSAGAACVASGTDTGTFVVTLNGFTRKQYLSHKGLCDKLCGHRLRV